jgi:hypothetical protein
MTTVLLDALVPIFVGLLLGISQAGEASWIT